MFRNVVLLLFLLSLSSCGQSLMTVSTKRPADGEKVVSLITKSGDSVAFGYYSGFYIAATRTVDGQSMSGANVRIPIDSIKELYVERMDIPDSIGPSASVILIPAVLYLFFLVFLGRIPDP